VWPFIKDLHAKGPWAVAGRLSSSDDAVAKTYLVLAAACHEAGREGYSASQYMVDRKKVMEELGSFSLEQFDARKEELRGRVKNLESVTRTIGGVEVAVPVAEGDVALPLSMDGHRGFAERFNPTTGGFDREDASTPGARVVWVSSEDSKKQLSDMTPAVKRIAPGFVLAYGNKDLAVDLVARATSRT